MSAMGDVAIISESTEIRAEETAKGGMAYEVILSQPQIDKRPPSPPKTNLSVEDIQNKLKAAEERRQSLEAQKLSQLADRFSKIEEATQKKNESIDTFKCQAKEQLSQKMEALKENREAYLNKMKTKLKEHDDHINEVKKSIEKQKEENRESLEKKLAIATDNRDKEMQKMLEKLKKKDETIQKVRKANEEKVQILGEKIEKKLEIAQENREAAIQVKLENLKEHEKHVLQVRQLNQVNTQVITEQTLKGQMKRLETAGSKRAEQLDAIKGRIQERGRHAELVRQNKALNSSG